MSGKKEELYVAALKIYQRFVQALPLWLISNV
jgi:hypothetical protein